MTNETTKIPAASIKEFDIIIWEGEQMGPVSIVYPMIDDKFQIRFLPGGSLAAITIPRQTMVEILKRK